MNDVTLNLGVILNGLVVVGVGVTLRILHKMYGDLQTLKAILGVNGVPGTGIVHEVQKLRETRHAHANAITALNLDVAMLKEKGGTHEAH